MQQLKELFKNHRTEILSVIVLTTSFLSVKSILNWDDVNYINAVSAVVLWVSAVGGWRLSSWKTLGQTLINKM